MKYNGWKLMDKITVAVKGEASAHEFTGYVVDAKDKAALKNATDWARVRNWNRETKKYDEATEPSVHTFDNEGFTARIVASAGGSSQGGRLSFWRCEVEKDGVRFSVGVNDVILADLIKNSDMSNGEIKQKVMFARRDGKPGLIHKDMDAYKEAVADMEHKASFNKVKKTKKWELGGVYSTLTQTDICLGEVYDTLEPYTVEEGSSGYRWGSRRVTKYRELDEPVKMTAWINFSTYTHKDGMPEDLETFLKEELKERTNIWFQTGTPPARGKASQLEVKESDKKLLDKMLAVKAEYGSYYNEEDRTKGRYVREVK